MKKICENKVDERHQIVVDGEVHDLLNNSAKKVTESFNTTLRRLLGMPEIKREKMPQ